jgi:F-type H+-transporting ATPase subunit c
MNVAHLAAGFGMALGAFPTALGIAWIASRACEGTARQPEAGSMIRTTMLIAAALVEAIALYLLVICIILTGK